MLQEYHDHSWVGTTDTFTVQNETGPPLHQGFLWKKSPNPLRIRKYQQRYVELALGVLSWSAAKGALNKGRVDFSKNKCEITEVRGSDTEFEVRPLGGEWVEGDFTGIESGRALVFDSGDSEHNRSKWIEVIQLHMTYGQKYSTTKTTAADDVAALSSLADGFDDFSKPAWIMESCGSCDSTQVVTQEVSLPTEGNSDMIFHLEQINFEDEDGSYPLKEKWDMRVPKPPVVDRKLWKGVFAGAPTSIVEDLMGNARYQHSALPLDHRKNEPNPKEMPNEPEHAALRHVMEFINYHIVLQGRPPCFYGGIGPAPAEMRNMQNTKSGLFPGHFECQACFACPHGGNGGVSDLVKNCWNTQAMVNHGGFQWMSLTAGHNGEEFVPFTAPFGLRAVPIPPRAERAELLRDPEYTKDCADLTSLASSLYVSGHGPYLIVYKRPEEHNQEQEDNPSWAWERSQEQVNQVAPGNDSRVLVYPPPGMIVKGGFQGERIGGRKGLPGEDAMAQEAGVSAGSTLGGPAIKVHFYAISDHGKYQGCDQAKLLDLETGEEVPVWVSDSMAEEDEEYFIQPLNDVMDLSAGKVWMIPKPVLSMSHLYQCSMKIRMDDGPIDLVWSWITFGPRVYDVPSPNPEDTTKSLDWALESVSDMRMKPLMRPDGTPVPSVICIRPGTYVLHARFIDPGAWLHIEGAGVEETTLVVEAPDESETFDFPPELGPNGLRGQKTGYEYGWQNPDVPLFNMAYNCFRPAEHNGGAVDPGGWKQPRRIVSISGLTLRHNIPLVLGGHGCLELVDCHVIGPTAPSGDLMLNHHTGGPLVRLSEVTHQPAGLFNAGDRDCDGLLSLSDFQTMVRDGAGLGPEDAEEMFKEADIDQDGFLSRKEFESAYYMMITSLEPVAQDDG